ncbi:uncharacterized protein LOC106176608 [Lingula anatina]|uniref:Uncharacterized protein LOC106176608 n=1 Tax=Lingula anatina TaxID=7574 RepID=A0A1S3JWU1_LINAN|nr:uncharacterized protein LOC106176608 [Lingula anatina]|eukprot:XP_013414526.1 uncharacterized protein LOC106176608 [Lingula anatina]
MKIILVCLALLGATYAYPHLPIEEVEKRCLVDKPEVSQGVAYVSDSDCAYYWQCDFAYTVLKNVTLKKCPIGTMWAKIGVLPHPPQPGEEPVVCVNCAQQPDPECHVQYPQGSEQCPNATTPGPTTTEKPRPLGPKICRLEPQNMVFQEIVGEISEVWYWGANETFSCGHLIFNFKKCECEAAPEFPARWNFDVNLNSYKNRLYAANEPVGTVGLSVIEPGCAEFNGTGGLQIPYFKNMRPRKSWVTAVVFNRDPPQNATILYECITIFIYDNDWVKASVVVQNPLGGEETLTVSVHAPGGGYILVIVIWDGKTLTLAVFAGGNLYVNSVTVSNVDYPWSIVCLPAQPLFVGYVPWPFDDDPALPGSYSGNICLLFFTDKRYDNPDAIKADILLDYVGPPFG